jgi:hypothetical protein
VADFVHRDIGAAKIGVDPPAEIHGPLVLSGNVDDIAADIGPGAVALQESNADLRIVDVRHLLERDADIDIFPGLKAVAYEVHFRRRSGPGGGWEKVVAQLRAVHLFLVEIADQALPVRRHVGA